MGYQDHFCGDGVQPPREFVSRLSEILKLTAGAFHITRNFRSGNAFSLYVDSLPKGEGPKMHEVELIVGVVGQSVYQALYEDLHT